jgi:two-component system response regulator NreC
MKKSDEENNSLRELISREFPDLSEIEKSKEYEGLTRRELEILFLLAHCYSMGEIAQHYGITTNEVRSVQTTAAEKLHLKSRGDIIRFAASRGWLPPD